MVMIYHVSYNSYYYQIDWKRVQYFVVCWAKEINEKEAKTSQRVKLHNILKDLVIERDDIDL